MRRYLEALATVVIFGTSFLGMGAIARAQEQYPASQQPEEIPAQYPPQQGGQQQGRPPQGNPRQQGPDDSGAARISFIRGDVSTQHSGSSDWGAATLNTPVVTGDQVATGKNSRGEIELDHANILRMSDESAANITTLSRTQIQLQIGQGLVNYDVLKGSEANVEIETPNVAIRPQMGEGSYRIQVNSNGETIVDVRNGSAEISTPQGSTTVERDQRITIQGNADNAQYQVSGPSSRDDWDKWNADRDHIITSADSWRHTNPYYTGSQDLDPYGQWNDVPDYGSVWFPSQDAGWAPYRDGRWVYEPYYGWTWVSYEPWGWAPYHYGRWFVYGGNWGWWPGPVYGGYRPIWAPAYVSFFGFGGGGWGVNFGFGSGGFGNIGWLPCGPGDRFYPWYGRGGSRVNEINVYNIHDNRGGFGPLREGPHAFSNVNRAFDDQRVRGGISSMRDDQFGRGRVPMHQQGLDAGSFRQARMMTGANPVSPSRQSFHASDRQVSPSAIPNRANSNQRFFSSNARLGGTVQAGRGPGSFNRGGNTGRAQPQQGAARPGFQQMNRPPQDNNQGQRGFTPPSQSSRPGWRTFTPPSRQSRSNDSGRAYEGQGGGRSQSNFSPSAEPSRQPQSYSRGGSGFSRPPLNMQQPVVTPRERANPAPSMRSAPNGGGYRGSSGEYRGGPSGGSNRGGYSGGGSRGGSSSSRGGHSSSGRGGHR